MNLELDSLKKEGVDECLSWLDMKESLRAALDTALNQEASEMVAGFSFQPLRWIVQPGVITSLKYGID